jgi:two-component system invasion response regulator UvrY
MKILIVDDHAVILQGLKRILGDEFAGASFGEAHDFQQAVDLLRQERWNVVILDIDLPGRSGLDVLRQIKGEHLSSSVIVFSMYPEEQFAVRALKAGASGYVAKDSSSEQLVEAIRKVVGGGKYVSATLAERLAADLGEERLRVPHEILSDREFEVMRMMAAGKGTTAIAELLSLSVKTVSTYRTRILEKLQFETTSQLIRYAIEQGLDR